MNDYTPWIALVCLVGLIVWFLTKKRRTREIWETTPVGTYEVKVTDESISCVHPKRATELIRWDDIDEVCFVTTSDGPFLADKWFRFVGADRSCSVPSEAKGFDQLWDIFKTRFPGFDYQEIIESGTSEGQRVLWTRSASQTVDATADPPSS